MTLFPFGLYIPTSFSSLVHPAVEARAGNKGRPELTNRGAEAARHEKQDNCGRLGMGSIRNWDLDLPVQQVSPSLPFPVTLAILFQALPPVQRVSPRKGHKATPWIGR